MILAPIGEPSLGISNPKRPGARVLSSFVFLDTTGSMSTWSCSVAITTSSDRTEL